MTLRVMNALREWIELRARVRDEREFHIERAAADLRALDVPAREARRRARARFGSPVHSRLALEVLGGDWSGLRWLLSAHRTLASAWVQPVVLMAVIAGVFLVSPARQEIVDGMLVRVRTLRLPGAVALSVEGRSPWSGGGTTSREFEELRSMATLADVGRYEGLYAQAKIVGSATLDEVQAEARARTSEPFVVRSIADRKDVAVGPAQIVWMVIGVCGFAMLMRYGRGPAMRRWVWYAVGVMCLNAAASMAACALAIQVRPRGAGGAVVFTALLIGAATQCRWFWKDLLLRCPACLERMVLPLTSGEPGCVLINPVVTESVCVHGHGVLAENRWRRCFRAEVSPMEQLL